MQPSTLARHGGTRIAAAAARRPPCDRQGAGPGQGPDARRAWHKRGAGSPDSPPRPPAACATGGAQGRSEGRARGALVDAAEEVVQVRNGVPLRALAAEQRLRRRVPLVRARARLRQAARAGRHHVRLRLTRAARTAIPRCKRPQRTKQTAALPRRWRHHRDRLRRRQVTLVCTGTSCEAKAVWWASRMLHPTSSRCPWRRLGPWQVQCTARHRGRFQLPQPLAGSPLAVSAAPSAFRGSRRCQAAQCRATRGLAPARHVPRHAQLMARSGWCTRRGLDGA